MKTYQYILLDWDGNLARTLDVWLAASHAGLRKRGFDLSDAEVGASFGKFTDHYHQIGVKDPDILLDEVMSLAAQKMPDVELYPDALEVLQYLHDRGKRLALVTTGIHDTLGPTLDKFDLRSTFDVIITGGDVTHHKPHPEPLEKALEALGGTKDQAIMIGDSDKDVGAARNFGIDSIIFMPPEHEKFYDFRTILRHEPTFVVTKFANIKQIVL